ncbi:MAG: hypothetical protein IIB83_01100 [Bacteroidetes bacterium]|nr:hypothetical protein [Bacteroidota bacterium]
MAKKRIFKFVNKKKVLASFETRNKKFIMAVRTELILGADEFIEHIRAFWYSGRRADDTGLNKLSKALHNFWTSEPTQGTNFIGVSMKPKVNYAIMHEQPGKKLGETENILKKRTDILGDLNNNLIGGAFFKKVIKNAMKKAF